MTFYALEDAVYDGGKGNLCANCHQPRRAIAAPDPNGMINVSSSHWGPHHGPQSAMMLGLAGAGEVGGQVSTVKDSMTFQQSNGFPQVNYVLFA